VQPINESFSLQKKISNPVLTAACLQGTVEDACEASYPNWSLYESCAYGELCRELVGVG
jgi:hypothetical protein